MWMWLALLAVASFSVMVSGYALVNRKQLRELESRYSQQLAQMQRDLQTANSVAVGMGQRLLALEKRVDSSAGQGDKSIAVELDALDMACKDVASGSDPRALALRYGLSESEAKLLAMMQQHKQTTAAS
jgi:hypothetical protein